MKIINLYSKCIEFKRENEDLEMISKLKSKVVILDSFSNNPKNIHSIRKFEGVFNDNGIQIRRVVEQGVNSFVPICHVRKRDNLTYSVIFHLPKYVIIFLIIVKALFLFLFSLLIFYSNVFNFVGLIFCVIFVSTIIIPRIVLRFEIEKVMILLNSAGLVV